MAKGIILGVSAQLAFAIGLTLINQAVFDNNQQFLKSNLVLLFAGFFSSAILGYCFLSTPQYLTAINSKNCLWLLSGSLFLLVIGEYLLIKGASVSNVTVVSLTALAFPVVALVTESITSKVLGQKMPTVETNQLVGFLFIAAGFVIYTAD